MTDWLAIIERAAYTRFCKTGSLEPFRLARADLHALVTQATGGRALPYSADIVRIQVQVPVARLDHAVVLVDEWT